MNTPTPYDHEALYDAEIGPLLRRIVDICTANKVPMVASVAYAYDATAQYKVATARVVHSRHNPQLFAAFLSEVVRYPLVSDTTEQEMPQ